MDANGWKAVLIYGDAAEHSALAWFSDFTTRLRWGMALLPREGEPRLLISMSSRDVPAMKLMTWIPDVLSGWTWESAFDPWLARFTGDGPLDIGTVGFDLMRPPLSALAAKEPRQPLPPARRRRRGRGDAHAAAARAVADPRGIARWCRPPRRRSSKAWRLRRRRRGGGARRPNAPRA